MRKISAKMKNCSALSMENMYVLRRYLIYLSLGYLILCVKCKIV
jgi:hypothetical protein